MHCTLGDSQRPSDATVSCRNLQTVALLSNATDPQPTINGKNVTDQMATKGLASGATNTECGCTTDALCRMQPNRCTCHAHPASTPNIAEAKVADASAPSMRYASSVRCANSGPAQMGSAVDDQPQQHSAPTGQCASAAVRLAQEQEAPLDTIPAPLNANAGKISGRSRDVVKDIVAKIALQSAELGRREEATAKPAGAKEEEASPAEAILDVTGESVEGLPPSPEMPLCMRMCVTDASFSDACEACKRFGEDMGTWIARAERAARTDIIRGLATALALRASAIVVPRTVELPTELAALVGVARTGGSPRDRACAAGPSLTMHRRGAKPKTWAARCRTMEAPAADVVVIEGRIALQINPALACRLYALTHPIAQAGAATGGRSSALIQNGKALPRKCLGSGSGIDDGHVQAREAPKCTVSEPKTVVVSRKDFEEMLAAMFSDPRTTCSDSGAHVVFDLDDEFVVATADGITHTVADEVGNLTTTVIDTSTVDVGRVDTPVSDAAIHSAQKIDYRAFAIDMFARRGSR